MISSEQTNKMKICFRNYQYSIFRIQNFNLSRAD